VVKARLRGEARLVRYTSTTLLIFSKYRSGRHTVFHDAALTPFFGLGISRLTLEADPKTNLVEFGRIAQNPSGKYAARKVPKPSLPGPDAVLQR